MDQNTDPIPTDTSAHSREPGAPSGFDAELPWFQSLNAKLALLFLLLTLALAAAAIGAGGRLMRDRLVDESLRYQFESARTQAGAIQSYLREVEVLASTVMSLAAASQGGAAAVGPFVPKLIETSGVAVTGIGIWPEPAAANAPRASVYWLRGDRDALRARHDYNDPQAVPYWREKWYAPARFAEGHRCYWTPPYVEPLSKRPTLTCAMPIHGAAGFTGVVTADIALEQLSEVLRGYDPAGYSLLIDSEDRVIGSGARARAALAAEKRVAPNLAELAQHNAGYNSLALALHADAGGPAQIDPALVTRLRAAARGMSEQEARAALARLGPPAEARGAPVTVLPIDSDPVLGEKANAAIVALTPGWRLLQVTASRSGFAGASLLYSRTVLVVAGAAALCLGLVYLILRVSIVGPLRRMVGQFRQASKLEDALRLALDATARNEVGQIANWHNERIRQLNELMERSIATNSHLVVETTARREATAALTRLQERAALTLQAITDGVITTDEKGVVEEMNAAAEDMTGHPVRDAIGRNFGAVFVARMAGQGGDALGNLAETAVQRGTRIEYPSGVVLSGFGGSRRPVSLIVTPVRTRGNRIVGTVAVFRALESVATAAAQTAEQPTADVLTGLPARAHCDRRLRALIEAAKLNQKRHAAIMIDLDNFRRVVESGGQPSADRVLTQVAELLQTKTASAGEVFRLTSDEFVVILEGFDADRARAFADALREALAATRMYWESRYFSVTASFGVAEFGGEVGVPGEVLRRADDACGSAKRAGRNTVKVFDSSMTRGGESLDDTLWIRRIRAGLEHDRFHLTTQYIQPSRAHLAEGAPFELFVALEDEEGFWASPGSFMPTAERHHLVPEIDRWVMTHAFEHFIHNPQTVERIAFASINVSSGTICDSTTLDLLVQLLQKSKVPPSKLCFEVDEDSILDHPHAARSFVNTVRSMGCRLAIDHFHGHRSAELELLRQLPTDFVKINAQEFKSIDADPVQQLVAETTIRLARTLRRGVIVSNIGETRQLEIWHRFGADYCQGFSIGKPSPVVFVPPAGAPVA